MSAANDRASQNVDSNVSVSAPANPIINVALSKHPGLPQPVSLGVPFTLESKTQASKIASLAIRTPSGDLLPATTQPLFNWPDGSVRWAVVCFVPVQGGEHELLTDATQKSPAVQNPVIVTQAADTITLSNTLASITLGSKGNGPIHKLVAQNHNWLDQPEAFRLLVESDKHTFDTTHETSRTLSILHQTPLRTRVRVEGTHVNAKGQRRLSYRLDIELWANLSAVRFDYHFFNLEPGTDAIDIDRIAMNFDFNLKGKTQRHIEQSTHGMYTMPRDVFNPAPVCLNVDDNHSRPCAEDPAMLLDDTDYPYYLRGPRIDTNEWMGIVSDDNHAVYGSMHEFAAMRPKRLASEDNKLSLDIWPRRAGALNLQQGKSRRQTFNLVFGDQGKLSAGQAAGQLKALLHEGRACLQRDWLVHCKVFDQEKVLAPGQNMRMEKYLSRLMRLAIPQTMFDLGDTAETHYQQTYAPLNYVLPIVDNPPPRVVSTGGFLMPVSNPLGYEAVWSNNEYDGIYAFCCELMRTGRPELWPIVRQLARHNMEVDFLHYSDHKWLHRATPAHSARHTSTGAYPSHFWTQGLVMYHCLSGDVDALEIANALGDKILENFTDPVVRPILWGFNRELGWPVLALSHLVDLTGDERHRKMLEELIEFLIGFDRDGFKGAVKLSSGNALHSMTRQIVDGFFGYVSMVEGVDHYLSHTDNPKASAWFNKLLNELTFHLDQAHNDGDHVSNQINQGMAIALDRMNDPKAVDLGMVCVQELIDSRAWSSPTPEVKSVATAYRGMIRFLQHAQVRGPLKELDYKRWK